MAGRGGRIDDNFNRSLTGSLGSTSSGAYPWTINVGTWDVNGTRPTTATAQSSHPHAVVNSLQKDVDVALSVGAGDAIYFRVLDSNDWWRLLWEGYQTSSCQTCYQTCCSTCCDTCSYSQGGCCTSCSSCGCTCSCCNSDGAGSACTCGCSPCPASCYFQGNCSGSCNCVSCNCYSCNPYSCNCTYYDNYRPVLQKMVAGTLTTVSTGSVNQGSSWATTRLRVVTLGNTITTYYGASGDTQHYSGSQADHATQTRHGIGRAASSYNSSAMDDFLLKWG
jgi:hypothetical protein